MTANKPVWEPDAGAARRTRLYRFMERLQQQGVAASNYDELWRFSIDEPARFWAEIWKEIPIRASREAQVVMGPPKMPGTTWFEGAALNFAENLLGRAAPDQIALIARDETGRREVLTQGQLLDRVSRTAAWLSQQGVGVGDRVAAFLPNREEAVIAMLAATWLGAIWSSCSPDFGFQGVLDRFGQIEPKVLFATDGYRYGGKTFDTRERVQQIAKAIPSLQKVVSVPVLGTGLVGLEGAIDFGEVVRCEGSAPPHAQLPFDHPVYILYSSGTTGMPKCIVHGAGGTLLQHGKELMLHSDVGPGDAICWFTTTGWMMWNWLVSALMTGARVILWDGSPAHPDLGVLWRMAEQEGLTHFGTSPKFLASCEKADYLPKDHVDLSKLRSVLSTGSPLAAEQFEWIARSVARVQIASISGGTDILGCFMLGSPIDPVFPGEIQKRGLGMAVEAWDESGRPVVGVKGELVCTRPFPSMPVRFWNDPGDQKYLDAYFRHWPGVWRHGDWVEITERGGVIVYGRSDATLNPGGVRIGTAEIYSVVENLPQIADSIVVSQDIPGENDVRIVLFVVMKPGVQLDRELEAEIRQQIRTHCTPRHVPARIVAVADIPRTISGKKVELAVQRILHGQPVTNRDALANPEALELFRDLPELKD